MKKYNYIYLITNSINGKQYVGKHSTDDFEDGYMGSGTILKQAIKKYGIDSFKKTILEDGIDREEVLNAREIFWIEKLQTKQNGYNLTEGGEGVLGFTMSETQRDKISMRTKEALERPEMREKISKHTREAMSNPVVRKKVSDRTREAMNREEVKDKVKKGLKEYSNRKEVKEEFSNRMKEWNANNPEWRERHNKQLKELWNTSERKEFAKKRALRQFEDPKQREAAAERARKNRNRLTSWEVIHPNGLVEIIDDLPAFSYKYHLDARGLRRVASGKQKQYKGFTCRKI